MQTFSRIDRPPDHYGHSFGQAAIGGLLFRIADPFIDGGKQIGPLQRQHRIIAGPTLYDQRDICIILSWLLHGVGMIAFPGALQAREPLCPFQEMAMAIVQKWCDLHPMTITP